MAQVKAEIATSFKALLTLNINQLQASFAFSVQSVIEATKAPLQPGTEGFLAK